MPNLPVMFYEGKAFHKSVVDIAKEESFRESQERNQVRIDERSAHAVRNLRKIFFSHKTKTLRFKLGQLAFIPNQTCSQGGNFYLTVRLNRFFRMEQEKLNLNFFGQGHLRHFSWRTEFLYSYPSPK